MKNIIILLFFVSNIYSQVEYSQDRSNTQYLPKFFIDLASYSSQDSGKSKLDVFIKVPYSNVQFIKSQDKYRANYSLIISLYDDDDDELKIEKLWNEKLETRNFKQTVSHTSYNVSYKSFTIEPGEYKFVCKIEDNESRKYSIFEQMIKVREFTDSIEISDLVLASGFIETIDGPKIIPNISNKVSSIDSSLSFFYEIYSEKPKDVKIVYSINNKEGKSLFIKEIDFNLLSGKTEINETLDRIVFTLGDYQLEIKIFDSEGKIITGTRKKFSSKLFGFPASVDDLDLSIKQMQYIATPSELDEIEDAENYSEKLKNFISYWKKLDPSPNTVENETLNEYYNRVEYANANFKGYFKGWRSDMGMVYITLGAPDQVTRRPYEMDSKPYEMWDYYVLNRRFIFVDQTNFGDYRLENPAYGNWFRYRP